MLSTPVKNMTQLLLLLTVAGTVMSEHSRPEPGRAIIGIDSEQAMVIDNFVLVKKASHAKQYREDPDVNIAIKDGNVYRFIAGPIVDGAHGVQCKQFSALKHFGFGNTQATVVPGRIEVQFPAGSSCAYGEAQRDGKSLLALLKQKRRDLRQKNEVAQREDHRRHKRSVTATTKPTRRPGKYHAG